jgi:hypothetical protein
VERVDLTRITILDADYARAKRAHDEADLRAFEAEVSSMLRDEVLPYAPKASAAGSTAQAAPERRVLALAHEFLSLEGSMDEASVARKSSILSTLKALVYHAHFPPRPRR